MEYFGNKESNFDYLKDLRFARVIKEIEKQIEKENQNKKENGQIEINEEDRLKRKIEKIDDEICNLYDLRRNNPKNKEILKKIEEIILDLEKHSQNLKDILDIKE